MRFQTITEATLLSQLKSDIKKTTSLSSGHHYIGASFAFLCNDSTSINVAQLWFNLASSYIPKNVEEVLASRVFVKPDDKLGNLRGRAEVLDRFHFRVQRMLLLTDHGDKRIH